MWNRISDSAIKEWKAWKVIAKKKTQRKTKQNKTKKQPERNVRFSYTMCNEFKVNQ